MSRTIMHHFDAAPAAVKPVASGDHAGVEIRQDGHIVDISSTDPVWLEELEGAVREAREALEARAKIQAVAS